VTDVVINLHHRPRRLRPSWATILSACVRYSWSRRFSDRPAVRVTRCRLDADTFRSTATRSSTCADADDRATRARGADVTVAVVPNPRPDHYHGMALDGDDA
jgi:hypothetical protein